MSLFSYLHGIYQYTRTLGDNYGEVTDNLSRGARPSRDRLGYLRSIGVREVIDLRDGSADFEEISACGELGLKYTRFSMSDHAAPDPAEMLRLVNILNSNNTVGIKTFVHCEGGRHRTSVVYAMFRVKYQGNLWDKVRAWKEAKEDYGFFRDPGHHGALEDWFFSLPPAWFNSKPLAQIPL